MAGAVVLGLIALCVAPQAAAGKGLSPEIVKALKTSKYVYIASTRKDGSLSRPAEIWFLYYKGSVYVASPPTTWRVRRIKAGRPGARIWVGKRDGPSFRAKGAIVNEPEVLPVLFETYARKYGARWRQWEGKFRQGLKDGSRVLIRYSPVD